MTPPTSTSSPSDPAPSDPAPSDPAPSGPAPSGPAPGERGAVEAAARATLARLVETWGRPELAGLGPEDDLFERLDSFAVVELLLETESEVEKAVGRYVPLADESILDSTRSPLRRLQGWFDYVAETVARG